MLLSCGDALIDFLPVRSSDGRGAFLPVVGGSCLNVAIGMARLGASAGFVGGVSTDFFGRMISDHAESSQVDLRYATRSARPTKLAFVRTTDGEPQYAFYDEGTASRHWAYRAGSIPFADIDAIHLGSTTLIDDRVAAETTRLVEDARGSTTISFDPNCRPNLVTDKAAYVGRMNQFAERADIVRLSESDFEFLYDDNNHARAAEVLLAKGPKLVIVTYGARGAGAWHRLAGAVRVDAPRVKIVDTIGAGDSFQAALLFMLRTMGCIEADRLARMDGGQIRRALAFAANCAAITCTRQGADPPRFAEVDGARSELG
jgi:fructokinase